MRLLDLFCGAGGASTGLAISGLEIEGVDINPQLNYPFIFHQADALTFPLDGFDAFWASPPCQGYLWATKRHRNLGKEYPDLVEPIRKRLLETGKPYIIENVPGAPIGHSLMLEGPMFDLGVIRRRYFETNFTISQPKIRKRSGTIPNGDYVTVAGNGGDGSNRFEDWKKAIGINWMTKQQLKQAVPPAYSAYIGEILLNHLK